MAIKKAKVNPTTIDDVAFNNVNGGYISYKETSSLTGKRIVVDTLDALKTVFDEDKVDYSNFRFLLLDDFGWFTIKTYHLLMNAFKDIEPNKNLRKKKVLSNIYVIPKDEYAKEYLHASFFSAGILDELNDHIIEKNFLELDNDMKIDVIMGNPPYQKSYDIVGVNSASGKSIYNLFMQKAFDMQPKYVIMITPSRWMLKSASGIQKTWINKMLTCNKFRIIHDFENANEIFPDVTINGGVNFFLWDRDYNGNCKYYFHKSGNDTPVLKVGKLDSFNVGIVIRNIDSYSVINKIKKVEGEYYKTLSKNFSGLVGSRNYFGNGTYCASNWTGYSENQTTEYCIKYYVTNKKNHMIKWVSDKQIVKNISAKDLCKILVSKANGDKKKIIGKPFIAEPNSVCSDSFLVIGYNHNFTNEQCENIVSYMKTKFFRYLVSLMKITQNSSRRVYQFVPMQDFNKPWTDKELYAKYGLTDEEIESIEKNIKSM